MKGTTRLLALCGVLTALGVVLLCLGGIVPFALYICPILASIALLPVRSRPRYAWCCYGAIALLGLLLCPDKEVSLLFCFTGYYPLLKPRLDALRSRLLSLTLKLLWAAVSMAALYALILYVFCLPAVVEEFAATGRWLLAATIAMGVALFFVYDVLLAVLWPAGPPRSEGQRRLLVTFSPAAGPLFHRIWESTVVSTVGSLCFSRHFPIDMSHFRHSALCILPKISGCFYHSENFVINL